MFGGPAFLINGNMSIAASGQGGLLVCARFEAPRQVRTDSTSPRNRRTCRRQPLQQVLQLFVIMCGGHATRVAAA
jgi:hypothetical protein